ncbi:MAG: M15 family metallopeptidase [Acidobacteriota bacterium]
MVELTKLDATIKLDIRYASRNNFLGKAVYKQRRAFLQRPAAKVCWDVTPPDKKIFVADPGKGSRHNRGCAVDLSLFDLNTGTQVKMPSEYDEMTEPAHINYECATPDAKRLRELLRAAMAAEGFGVYEPEWWHYDYKDWKEYPIMNSKFSAVK